MENLKRTPLYEEHVSLGAQMIPFAGYKMPLKYTIIKEEHLQLETLSGFLMCRICEKLS
jgi:aminomethyltransferase (EC 2.1.2.10)